MIAVRRLMIGRWGVEAGFRIHVVNPRRQEQLSTTSQVTIAQRAANEQAMFKRIDAIRTATERRWWEHGGR